MATNLETQEATQAAESRLREVIAPESRGRRAEVLGMNARQVAQGLGIFSIGLGLAELLAPKTIAGVVGTRNHKPLIRGYGLRETAAGIGILSDPSNAAWVWARVAGDALDLISLGSVLASRRNGRARGIFGVVSVAGVTMMDILCAISLTKESGVSLRGGSRAEASIIINRPVEQVYRFWHNFENLPTFLGYVSSVRATGERQSHWVAQGIGNITVEWDAEIVNDLPNQRISWRSLPGAQIFNTGSVEFEEAPRGRGTIVRVQIDYGNRLHGVGAAAAAFGGRSPEQMIYKDLRRLKQVLETGEVLRTEGQPSGRREGRGSTWLDHIAR
jgi:uncharacterized membrane protein